MTQLKYMPGTHVERCRIDAEATAGDADIWTLLQAPDDARLKVVGIRWIPDADVAGAAVDNFALAVQNRGDDGAGTTAITTTKTYGDGVDSVAQDAEDFTLTSTAADLVVDKNEVLALVRTINGNGLASPAGTLEVLYQFYGV